MKTMDEKTKKFLRILGISVVVALIGAVYLSLVFGALMKGYGIVTSPVSLIGFLVEHGFPKGIFTFLIVLIVGFIAFMFYKTMQEEDGIDIMGRKFKMAQDRQSYGDAHFETPEEYKNVAVVQNVKDAMGTILGQTDLSGKHLINYRVDEKNRTNQHIAVVGASGSGKTYTFSKPFCFQVAKRRESVIITDPDGGLYRDMAGYFKDQGYVVRRFDLATLKKSDGWHCLRSVLDAADPGVAAQMFAQTVINNVMDDPDSIYGTGPMSLLKALILRVCLGHDYPPEKKTIESVYELLQNPAGEEFLDVMFDESVLTDEEKPCLGPYLSFKQGSPNLRGNLIANLSIQLQLFQNKLVCEVLSTDDIDLTLPATQPCAYFCLFPDSHDTYKFIVSLFFSMLFIRLIDFSDHVINGPCPVPVNFLLDEFPSIGKLPDFDKKMAVIRKRAMNVVMIFQDITQLQNLYRTTWTTLLSNCSTLLSLGINDQFTSDLFTKRIGDTTIEVQTKKEKETDSLSKLFGPKSDDRSVGEGRRALLSHDELFKLDPDDSIIIFQGHNPIRAKKYPYVNHPDAKKLWQILPDDIPDITDHEGRKRYHDIDQAKVDAYLEKHPLSEVDRHYVVEYEPMKEGSFLELLKEITIFILGKFVQTKQDADWRDEVVDTEDEFSDVIDIDADEIEFIETEDQSQDECIISDHTVGSSSVSMDDKGVSSSPKEICIDIGEVGDWSVLAGTLEKRVEPLDKGVITNSHLIHNELPVTKHGISDSPMIAPPTTKGSSQKESASAGIIIKPPAKKIDL